MTENKTGFQQLGGYYPTAFQDQLSFRTYQQRTDLQHPRKGRDADAVTRCFSEGAHKLAIGHSTRGRGVVDTFQLIPFKDPFHYATEVFDMDPAIHLAAIALMAAQTELQQMKIRYDQTAGAKGDGCA